MVSQEKRFPGQESAASCQSPARFGLYGGKQKNRASDPGPRRRLQAGFVLLALVISLTFPSVLPAQMSCYPMECKEVLTFSWGVMPLYRFPSHVDGGGTLSVFSVIASAEVSKQITEKLGGGVRFGYVYDSYKFSGLTAFPVPRPWSSVHTFAIDGPLVYSLNDKWKALLIPTVQFSGEDGAPFGDSLSYGGVVGVSHVFGPKVELGIGIGVYYNLAQVTVYPYPIFIIELDSRIRLTNPFPAGPAGPAGAVLSYLFNKHWSVGVGGAYSSPRFRLTQNGPIPKGIGEYQSVPIFAQLTYEHSPAFKVDAYGGVSLFNQITIDDRDGEQLYRSQQDVAPLMGLRISGTF